MSISNQNRINNTHERTHAYISTLRSLTDSSGPLSTHQVHIRVALESLEVLVVHGHQYVGQQSQRRADALSTPPKKHRAELKVTYWECD